MRAEGSDVEPNFSDELLSDTLNAELIAWFNSQLAKRATATKICNLNTDLTTGVALIQLLEVIGVGDPCLSVVGCH